MQTLSDLISAPTENDRRAFQAVASGTPALRPGDLAMILRALSRYEIECHADSGRSFVASLRAKETDPKLAKELLFIADRQCADAYDARELADRLAKVAS